ncbi:MAG: PAS domain S-box protein [SAR324 cluster bacterium]|nr:PAS domain S-box protein [SAR324 cluster bacterium]
MKQAETELRESEERLKETAKTANVGGWETDLLGNTLSWTEETFRIYELEDYRLPDVGKAIQYYHPEDQQLVSDAVQRAIETGAEFDFEIRLITEKKNLKWVRTIGNIVMHEGNRVGLRGMIQDITNRKKAEEKVIDMNNKLTSTLNAIPDVLFEVDREGRLYFYHDPVFELLYAPPDELMGNLIIDVLPQNVADIIFEAIGEAGKTGSHYGSVFKLDRPDGEKWFELPLAAKGDYKDPDNHLIVMARNITKRKQAEEQLNKYRDHLKELVEERTYELKMAKDEAEHANQLKSEFLANMSHELRTPMHHILSYSHIGIKRYNSPKDRTVDCFEKVTSAGERMMNLINNLLDLSKLESKKMEYTLKENDVLVIINENIAGLIHLPEEKGISITITQPTVSTKVICDRSKISQVIQNLLSNSMQFSGKNKNISISFDSKDLSFIGRQEEPTTLSLMVSINDEGPGIPGDELESIFDKFIQSSKTKTGAGGTGLGLSICKKIIEDHHGKIWAKNNPEGGATFSFMLPYEQEIN